MKKLIFATIVTLFVFSPAEAQFLKNLKKKVEQKVENAVINNVSNKAAEEADKSLNKMWDTQLKNAPVLMGAERVDPDEIPASYDFDWEYTMNMETGEGDMDLVYHLKEDAPYFGIKVTQAQDMFMVMDMEKLLTVMFFSSDDNKFVSANKLNEEMLDSPEDEEVYEDMEINEIGKKTILGYECQGYKSENEDHIFTFYITDEAGVSFANMYQNENSHIPDGFNKDWLKDGLMMAMDMEDKNNPENNAKMTCTQLEKKAFSIQKSDYNSLGTN